ncbi:hypothetical protein KEJ39_09220 [Candidatus Bathyarchaeota archaeon]|nr:hypothetical protein [Candidatus Bathyarchaeota archaeon]
MSNIPAILNKYGETLSIKRRQQTGTDDYGKPIYTWNTVADEKIFLHPLDAEEIQAFAGEYTPKDLKGYFKPDSVVQENDHVTWESVDYEVKGLKVWKAGGLIKYQQAYLKRVS